MSKTSQDSLTYDGKRRFVTPSFVPVNFSAWHLALLTVASHLPKP